MVTVKLEVGFLYYDAVRNAAKELEANNLGGKLIEGKGWLSRPMWLTFDQKVLPQVKNWLEQFKERA